MTQGAHGGQSAPVTTDYDPTGARSGAAGGSVTNNGAAAGANGAPSPSTPTNSTPWGSTSTSSASGGYPSGYGAETPTWSSTPLTGSYAEAPTAAVPLVQDGDGAGRTATAPSSPSTPRTPRAQAGRARGPRRARLQLRHINPWTVLKFSCVLSIALFFVWLIVVGVLFGVLDAAGVIGKINETYTTIQGGTSKAPVTAGVVFGGAAIIGVVNIVLFIALSTVGSVVYNLCADLVGGVEVTLSER
jgi:hypothetical protein